MKIELFIEITGAVIGLTYLYLEYKASFWLWVAGIAMSLFYIYIYYTGKFYADMGTYIYYLGANIYGLVLWSGHKKKTPSEQDAGIGIRHVKRNLIIPLITACLVIQALLYFILVTFTDSPVPLGDSFTTALGIVAMWVMAKKYLEHWIFWIIVNGVSTALYFWKGLYPTGVLFSIYTVVSVMGYFKWKRLMPDLSPEDKTEDR